MGKLWNSVDLVFQILFPVLFGQVGHYRISRNSGRGSYPFVRQILPQNWVSAVLILGAVTINLV